MAVKEGLLSLLTEQPRHGYELKVEFEAVTGGVWTLNVGQVYSTLDRLVRDGLVTVAELDGDARRPQKEYSITAAGREELGAWWTAVPAEDPPPRDELMLKVLTAINQGRDDALAVITHQRTALFTLLQQRRRASPPPGIDTATISARLVNDALVVRAEADLRWLDQCEARVLHWPTPTTNESTDQPPSNPAPDKEMP